jgi:hypothetical protein
MSEKRLQDHMSNSLNQRTLIRFISEAKSCAPEKTKTAVALPY